MAEATGKPSDVVENALDAETLAYANDARRAASQRPDSGTGGRCVVIVYGSGTKTHDADFGVAAPAILRLMHENPSIVLRIVGELALAPAFEAFAERVERIAFTDLQGLPSSACLLRYCDRASRRHDIQRRKK